MVKVCATISDILAQRSCLINEQTLVSGQLLPPLLLALKRAIPVTAKHGKTRVLREALVHLRQPAEVEPAATGVLDYARVLAAIA